MENYYSLLLRTSVTHKKIELKSIAVDISFFCYQNYGTRLKLENLKPKGQNKIRSEEKKHIACKGTPPIQCMMNAPNEKE